MNNGVMVTPKRRDNIKTIHLILFSFLILCFSKQLLIKYLKYIAFFYCFTTCGSRSMSLLSWLTLNFQCFQALYMLADWWLSYWYDIIAIICYL